VAKRQCGCHRHAHDHHRNRPVGYGYGPLELNQDCDYQDYQQCRIDLADETWAHVNFGVQGGQNQPATDNDQIAKHNTNEQPQRDIARQGQHDHCTDDEHLVSQRIKQRAQATDAVKPFGDEAVESVRNAGGRGERQ